MPDQRGIVVETLQEEWKDIPEFANYQISNLGRVYSVNRDIIMQPSMSTFGHLKITLKSDWGTARLTRGLAQLVAEAFVEPPSPLCDAVAVLDGDFTNVAAYNLMWRPQWFVWKYTRQLKITHPVYYRNLPVADVDTGFIYNSIIEAGMAEGLLFNDIWRSTYTGAAIFPNSSIWEIVK